MFVFILNNKFNKHYCKFSDNVACFIDMLLKCFLNTCFLTTYMQLRKEKEIEFVRSSNLKLILTEYLISNVVDNIN